MSESRFEPYLGTKEFLSLDLWKAAAAECLGTLLLVLVACGTCTFNAQRVDIALAFGFSVATIVQCICHVSGGHINPAVTVGLLATCKVTVVRALTYIVVQIIGAVTGAGLIKGMINKQINVGVTMVNSNLHTGQGFGVELFITFVLVFTVYAVCDVNRTDVKGSAPLAIGLAIAMCHLFAVPLTGAGMNPARALGPAVAYNYWEDHWIYWVGPLIGGPLAGLLYHFVFSAPAAPVAATIVEDRPLILMRRSPAKLTAEPRSGDAAA